MGTSESCSSANSIIQQQPCASKPGSSLISVPPQRASPTSKLTQASLELSPDNQVKLVTTKQAGQQKVNHRQTSRRENAKRKRRSPLVQDGCGKRTKRKGGGVELMSPTIRDYFKTSDNGRCKAVNEPLRGETNMHAYMYTNFHSILSRPR